MTNELRIGNYVCPMNRSWEIHMPQTLVVLKVLTIGFDIETIPYNKIPAQIEKWDKYPARDIAGIPLTDEWLLKLGFENNHYLYIKGSFSLKLEKYSGNFYLANTANYAIEVQYVHQLQNLYFALTGKELAEPVTGLSQEDKTDTATAPKI